MNNNKYLMIRVVRLLVVVFLAFLLCVIYIANNQSFSNILMGVYNTSYSINDFDVELSGQSFNGAIPVSIDSSGNRSWGIKRNKNGKQPNPDPGSVDILNKHSGGWIGDTNKKIVYLTFDEGYENGYTDSILDTLKAKNVRAIFFITGPYLEKCQDIVQRFVDEGHYVGNHTVRHKSMPLLDQATAEKEILELEKAFEEKYDSQMLFFRPPKGEYNEDTLKIAENLRYTTLFWSFAYDDWYRDKTRGVEYVRDIISQNTHNGMIMLLHAVSRDNADALPAVIDDLRNKGYRFGDPVDLYTASKKGE